MKFNLATSLSFLLLGAVLTNAQQVRIGLIEYFGTKHVDVEKLKSSLPVHEGDELSFEKFPDVITQLKAAVRSATGAEPTDVAPGCCDANGNWFIYIGLPGKNVQSLDYNSNPRGAIRFPAEVEALYEKVMDLNMESVKARAIEDRTNGYALSSYPALRARQLDLHDYATHNPRLIHQVLSESADARQRMIAAQLLGYATYNRPQIRALLTASRDSDETVRNNAVRALGVLVESRPSIAQQIPATDFIVMLNSGTWKDRNKGSYLLSMLTTQRDPKLLRLLRERATDSLLEMARWREYGHAQTARVLLGRIAGIEEKELQKLAHDDVNAIIAAFTSNR